MVYRIILCTPKILGKFIAAAAANAEPNLSRSRFPFILYSRKNPDSELVFSGGAQLSLELSRGQSASKQPAILYFRD